MSYYDDNDPPVYHGHIVYADGLCSEDSEGHITGCHTLEAYPGTGNESAGLVSEQDRIKGGGDLDINDHYNPRRWNPN
jgi:hypothetical protein